MAGSPESVAVWTALTGLAPANPGLADRLQQVRADFERRGMFRSGAAVEAAMRLAQEYGYVWDDSAQRFRHSFE